MIREASVFINEVAEVLRVEGLARLAARDATRWRMESTRQRFSAWRTSSRA